VNVGDIGSLVANSLSYLYHAVAKVDYSRTARAVNVTFAITVPKIDSFPPLSKRMGMCQPTVEDMAFRHLFPHLVLIPSHI
jgi:hypothetical protein